MTWKPDVTVAAIVEHEGHYLLVEEETGLGRRFNQPAGHLEVHETLPDAVVRETLEETACHVKPLALIGVYHWYYPRKNITYIRFTYSARLTGRDPGRRLDKGIVRTVWMTADEIRASAALHRSPLVVRSLDDYLAGVRLPPDLIAHIP